MKNNNVKNNVENKIGFILLDDGHFLFKLKKKSTSSTWSYFDIINTNGITLIALIITIILMLILAGVVISLTIGENGLISTAKYTVVKNSEGTAREKLEIALADLQAHKYTDDTYNENEYINSYLENEGMEVVEDVATVNGWRFKIDRSVPKIGESLGQEEIKVTKIVREYLGKNENGKYIADVTIIIESDKAIKNIVFQEQDGTPVEVAPTTEKYKIAKDMTIELDKEYKIVINTDDGKSEERTIIEKLPDLGILISTPYVGTSSFTTKVQYITNEEDVGSYTYMLDEKEIVTNENKEYTLENYLEPETTYNIKVIAKYKNNLTVESNVVTIKAEPRTYLYNNGDECTDITGGWKAEAIGRTSNLIKPMLNTKMDNNYMNAYVSGSSRVGGSIMLVNEIEYSKYKKICMNYTASLGYYNSADGILISVRGQDNYLCYSEAISQIATIKVNIPETQNTNDIYVYLQENGNSRKVNINIYEVWLEK